VTKIPEENNLKVERFILAYTLKGFSPWLAESTAFKSRARQNIMAEGW
jgi:hypothetical protein